MSIKIYNGLILEGRSTKKLLASIVATKAAIQKLVDEKNAKVVGKRVSEYIDKITLQLAMNPGADLTNDELTNYPASDIYRDVRKEQETCRGGLSREPSIDCDVELIVNMHPKSGALLCRIQEERVGAYEAFLASPGFSDFVFWDNSERPENLSAKSWNRRRKIWDEACDDTDSKAFSFKWVPGYLEKEALIAALPSFESRVLGNAKNWAYHLEVEKIPEKEVRGGNFSPYMRAMGKVDQELSEMKGELFDAYCERQSFLRKTLIEDLAPCIGPNLKTILTYRPK